MDLITPDFGTIFWQTVTLLVVILILGKYAWPSILQTLRERENHIAQSLKNAEEAKVMIASMKEEQTQMLERIATEEKKIILEAINSKIAILKTANLEAKQIGEQMLQQAKKTLERERELAFDELKKDVAILSVQIAEKILIHELSSQKLQEGFVERLIDEIKE